MFLPTEDRVFLRPFPHGRDLSLPYGGTSAGGQSVNGGTHEGDLTLIAGLYHKLKVLLLLSCSYTMQFIGYDCIETR